ncbi:unnamed protein product [Notodromas monacha]|uniref:PDZ domain-containing protein n=1 Tax=Notodromas monacha TaxID=399045 RepID=A0A7R9BJW1_9CRUS|nr:unnamed protein product [Notodromas monacha]CAG0915998.1 unnamed protein product [Notodromas monacha]
MTAKSVPQPRLCRITKWPDFDGYGFHLQAIKSKPGQFIGKIDDDSPAEKAGLKQGDRIVEVNGVNINNENHLQVVERIKANPQTVDLLVVDPECFAYYNEKNMVIESSGDDVLLLANEIRKIALEEEEVPSVSSESMENQAEEIIPKKVQQNATVDKVTQSTSLTTSPAPANGSSDNELNFDGISAAEMRARLAGRKRPDPRQETLSAAQKHQIIQAL